jgi:GNAT superfamily N-acetyltransferase
MSAEQLSVRPATPADAEPIVRLIAELGYPGDPIGVKQRLMRALGAPDVTMYVAEAGGQVIGLASSHVFELLYRSQPQAHLTTLVVSFEHRRRGAGAALVAAIERDARERGCSRLELTTRRERRGVLPFYAALGFNPRPHRLVKQLVEDEPKYVTA